MSWPKVKSGWAPIGGVIDLSDEEECIDLTSDDDVARRVERALDSLLEQAAQMDAECTSPPCVHAPGIRIAVGQVREAMTGARG